MKRVLILGGAGQDGKYFGEILKSEGNFEITITARSVPSIDNPTYISGVPYLPLDITDLREFARVFEASKPDVIVNFASISSVIECEANPLISRAINEVAPLRIMDFLDKQKSKKTRFIQASSSEMYSNSLERIITESTQTAPKNEYGQQKSTVHLEIIERQKAGQDANSLILFNHESSLRADKFVSKKIVSGVNKIVNGSNQKIVLGNLESTRDWGFAGDYMKATLAVVKSDLNCNYVIGSGELHSIREFCKKAFEFAGIENYESWITSDRSLMRSHDSIGLQADPSKIRSDLKWYPTMNFDDLVHGMLAADANGTLMI